jgi:proline dehydrogenase
VQPLIRTNVVHSAASGFYRLMQRSVCEGKRFAPCIPSGLIARFIAGEDIEDAVRVVQQVKADGCRATINLVGTHISEEAETREATELILQSIEHIHSERCEADVSVKLTGIGLDIDQALCAHNLNRILEKAGDCGIFVCIDMEESAYVRQTLTIFSQVRSTYGEDAVGITFPSYLREFRNELDGLIEQDCRIRVVRGGYWEPATVAYAKRDEIAGAFRTDVVKVMRGKSKQAIATHDENVIALTTQLARDRRLSKEDFELQMLLGVRPDLQISYARQGYRLRVYVPYGKRWQPYWFGCVRRLATSSIRWDRA